MNKKEKIVYRFLIANNTVLFDCDLDMSYIAEGQHLVYKDKLYTIESITSNFNSKDNILYVISQLSIRSYLSK